MLRPATGDSATPKIGFSLPVTEGRGGRRAAVSLAAGGDGALGAGEQGSAAGLGLPGGTMAASAFDCAAFTACSDRADFGAVAAGEGATSGGSPVVAAGAAERDFSCSSRTRMRCSMH